jgi:hypothetical protein
MHARIRARAYALSCACSRAHVPARAPWEELKSAARVCVRLRVRLRVADASAPWQEELNNAAGSTLVEGTPLPRRLRSSSTKASGLLC